VTSVEGVGAANRAEAEGYLARHEDSAQFLCGASARY
jgi:hypothetical protein